MAIIHVCTISDIIGDLCEVCRERKTRGLPNGSGDGAKVPNYGTYDIPDSKKPVPKQ